MEKKYIIELTKLEMRNLAATLITCERLYGYKIPNTIWSQFLDVEEQVRTKN